MGFGFKDKLAARASSDKVEEPNSGLEQAAEEAVGSKRLSFAERMQARIDAAKAAKGKAPASMTQVAVPKPVAAPIEAPSPSGLTPTIEQPKPRRFGTAQPTAVAEAVAAEVAKGSLTRQTLVTTFCSQRFTLEEAEEEAEAILRLIEEEPSLEAVWINATVPLNSKQLTAVSYALKGKSFVLTGAAGTGKTTAQAAVVEILDKLEKFASHDFKYIGEQPSIAIVAFTKVAVRNIQKAIRKNPRIAHFAKHCMTIHALLEFEPVKEERRNPETGQLYEIRVFRPQRTAERPLTLTHLIIEEASMVGLNDLWKPLYDALSPMTQTILLGDINQLKPIFSMPLLGYGLVKLPVINLDRVYRQALDNPIIANAHRVLKGEAPTSSPCGKVAIVSGTNPTLQGQDRMASAIAKSLGKLWKAGEYDPEQDMVLVPWNKQALGVRSMNSKLATIFSGSNTLVYPVSGGMNSWWLAIGDKVLIDKRAGKIVNIVNNPKYSGRLDQEPGFFTRDGVPILTDLDAVDFSTPAEMPTKKEEWESIDYTEATLDEAEETARAATHIVYVAWDDAPDQIAEFSTAGDFSDSYFQLGYVMTVHKAQGSEWRKVFIIIHKDHMGFLSRELMYTAITRAREELVIFAVPIILEAACKKQEIKGDTLEDKIAYFNSGGLTDLEHVQIEKDDWHDPYEWGMAEAASNKFMEPELC